MVEFELKLEVPPVRKAEVLGALELTRAPAVSRSAHYFDTEDGRLSASGLALRLRREGRRWVQTLKASGDSPVHRLEDSVAVRAPKGIPSVDLDRHGSPGAREALERALTSPDSPQWPVLVERFLVKVSRRARHIELADEHLEIAFDVGTMEAAGKKLPICELAIKLQSGGSSEHMFELAKRLVHEHHLWLSLESTPVTKALKVNFDPDDEGDQQLRAMVRHCLWQILPNASKVAAGSEDSEQVHQLRVGLRRLRTVLREVGGLAPDVDPSWETPLSGTFRQLGVCRDQESMAKNLQPRLLAAGAPEVASWPPPMTVAVAPSLAVRDPGFQTALLGVLAFSLRRKVDPLGKCPSSRRVFAKKLNKLHVKVMSDGRCFTQLPIEQQHRVRKLLKRLRYLAEFAKPLFKQGKVERYLQRLRPAQDALGAHNDDAVVLEAWQRHPPTDAGAWFAVGWLSANQVHTAEICRHALKQISNSDRFWA
ncbi:CHAD domain-containing protein [Aquabacterium sp.]|uniref:CYTH and CHAD domain-containing protein n=1 Tax=Aquabacterium sp. TaxID=1872578 RepID=UPI00248714FA|nr:CHAD domain-containing protein [Aquabacterium sp.]MDI1260482.1 CHAD domain-containing protein [Aquabacterium sp.]